MSKSNVSEKKDKNIFEIIISIILILMIIVFSSLIAAAFITPKYSGKLLFNIDDKVFATVEVGGKESFVLPNPEAKDGYSFGGWYFDKDTLSDPCTPETISNKKLKGDTNVFAKWIKNEYGITYNLDDGVEVTANPSGYAVDTATITLNALTKLGYTFDGWYDNAEFKDKAITEIATGSTGNKTFYAKWTKNDFAITYNLDGGENAKTNPSGYAIDTATITLNDPTKVGYTFGGWYSEDTFATKVTEIATGSTGNKTVFAKWTKDNFTIIYNLDGGVEVTANPSEYDVDTATITLAALTKLGYTFDGWYDNAEFKGNAITEIAKGSTGNKTFYAKWTINNYTIKYVTNGGAAIADTPYTILTMPTSFATPIKIGYTLVGWYDNAEFTGSPITAITKDNIGDKTLYANWTKDTYTITYAGVDGVGVNNPNVTTTYTFDTPTITIAAATWKEGAKFAGWSIDGNVNNATPTRTIAKGSRGDITFTAHWTLVTYYISYNLDGGSNNVGNVDSYNIDTDTIRLLEPTHPDRADSFDGWYIAPRGGSKVTEIAKGSIGSYTLYARWNFTATDGLTYTENYDHCVVTGITTASANVVIPRRHNNKLVTTIASNAFLNKTSIESVVLPTSLTNIGSSAFKDCTKLASVNIPNSVVYITDRSFQNTAITSIDIPGSVKSVGAYAFANCAKLASVDIPDNVKSIGAYAFAYCASLMSIFIPENVGTLGANVCSGCPNVVMYCERIYIPSPGWDGYWKGDVPSDRILMGQTRPKLVP